MSSKINITYFMHTLPSTVVAFEAFLRGIMIIKIHCWNNRYRGLFTFEIVTKERLIENSYRSS